MIRQALGVFGVVYGEADHQGTRASQRDFVANLDAVKRAISQA